MAKLLKRLAGVTGLEPATSGVTGLKKTQLNQERLQPITLQKALQITKSCNTVISKHRRVLHTLSTSVVGIALICIFSTQAYAGCEHVAPPPQQFDHKPEQFVPVKYAISQRALNAMLFMTKSQRASGAFGCGFYSPKTNSIWLSPSLKGNPKAIAATLRHEYGHANGCVHPAGKPTEWKCP